MKPLKSKLFWLFLIIIIILIIFVLIYFISKQKDYSNDGEQGKNFFEREELEDNEEDLKFGSGGSSVGDDGSWESNSGEEEIVSPPQIPN